MRNKKLEKIISKIFALYKQNSQIILVLFGIKIKFKYPGINLLEDACLIQNLKELQEKNTKFPHPIGIVINSKAKIGHNCVIFQNVTIGDKLSNSKESHYPTIGNNVLICANALILGDVKVGNNAIIGAGAIVLHDVPENAVVAGNPAKVIKMRK
jgi:serine O-acetyltransferase